MWPFEEEEWSEHYYVEGVNIGISGFLTATIEQYLDDVLNEHKADDERQMRLAAIRHAVPLHGGQLLNEWQTRVISYPYGLTVALINEQLAEDEKWWGVDMWVARGSHLALIDLLHHMEIKTLRILLALNRIYMPDPRFKWTDRLIAQMIICPENLSSRLKQVFTLAPAEAAKAMEAIFYETLELVAHHASEVDVSFVKRWYSHRRPVNSRPV